MAETVSNIPDHMEKMTINETSSLSVQDECKSPENSAEESGSNSCNNGTDRSSIISSTATDCSNAENLNSTSTDVAVADASGASASQEAPQLQDQTDAGGFSASQIGMQRLSSQPCYIPHQSHPKVGYTNTHKDSYYYSMNGAPRGYCLIFNHMNFDHHLRMNRRNGTDKDRDEIGMLFKELGFIVKRFDDFTEDKIKTEIDHYSLVEDHSQYDCLVVFILTHGEDGFFYARDNCFKHETIFKAFEGDQCPSLAGKPKLFFIQACRGDKLDSCIKMYDQTDAPQFSHKLPVTADVLTMWSTVPGYYSWRNTTNGSWFIQSLLHVLRTHARKFDLQAMHAIINRHMIYEFTSNVPREHEEWR